MFERWLAVVLMFVFHASSDSVLLTIGYCPTAFTGQGAVVKVDPQTGNYTIMHKFGLPKDIFGCPIEEDPIVTFDYNTNYLYLTDFDEDFLTIVLDVVNGKIISSFKPKDLYFAGFENAYYESSSQMLKGVTPTVEEDGFCFDGCFAWGQMNVPSGKYQKVQDIPFKAMLDDSHFVDLDNHKFWIQASYDLRDASAACAPKQSDECLLSIDSQTGALLSSVFTPNFTVYKYAPQRNSDGTVLAWMNGFDSLCNNPYDEFLFGYVNLEKATAEPIACISTDTVVDMDEWISSFSPDLTMMATGSGNAYAGQAQLLVFDTANAKTIINGRLSGLGNALGAYMGLFSVWSVDWIQD